MADTTSQYEQAREATAHTRQLLTDAMGGVDIEQWLVDLDAAGASINAIRRELIVRTNATVVIALDDVCTLVAVAKHSRPHNTLQLARRADAKISNALHQPFKAFLSDLPDGATAYDVEHAIAERAGRSPVALAGVRLAMALHRGEALLPTVQRPNLDPGQSKKARSAALRKAAQKKARHTAPRTATTRSPSPSRGSTEWLDELEQHLNAVLLKGCRGVTLTYVRTAMSQGASEKEAFVVAAKRLRQQGARSGLTGDDVRLLLTKRGWWRERVRSRPRPTSSSGRVGGFWSGIRHERHVRPVHGGLPSLGKRR